MRAQFGGLGWNIEALISDTATPQGCRHVIVQCNGRSKEAVESGVDTVFAMLTTGRETWWRTKPEYAMPDGLNWTGYARFSYAPRPGVVRDFMDDCEAWSKEHSTVLRSGHWK